MGDGKKSAVRVWQLANLMGIFFAIWAAMEFRKFDPHLPFFSQPHWWLLLLIWLTNPRALPVYYIFCAQPPIGEWFIAVLTGCVLVPGAWGLYYLPGLDANTSLRVGLGVVGFLCRDVIEKNMIEGTLENRFM